MLLLPIDRACDWRRPPLVTLLLVLLNVGSFFLWQSGDDQAMLKAMAYYGSSGLVETEYPHFKKHMRRRGRAHEVPSLAQAREQPELLYFLMLDEGAFLQRLENGRMVLEDAAGYRSWRSKRDRFNQLLERVTSINYGWQSAQPDWTRLMGHMFLHADLMHLVGNMVFLLAVGFLVETVLAGWAFLLCYLLAGFGAAGLDSLMRPDSLIPGIGASGAISGVMGMYAVLYWNRSVRVFYFLFVYFDSIRLPAITLLPLWIGNELYQMWSNPESNINFVAHLGGLFSGAVIGWLARGTVAFDMHAVEEQDQEDDFKQRIHEARQLCERQDFKAALPRLRALYREHPDSQQVQYHLFLAERLFSAGEEFHEICNRILSQSMHDPASAAMVQDVFESYVRLARPGPRISPDLARRLISRFTQAGETQAVRYLQQLLQKRGVESAQQPSL